jgi:hypothetical protein
LDPREEFEEPYADDDWPRDRYVSPYRPTPDDMQPTSDRYVSPYRPTPDDMQPTSYDGHFRLLQMGGRGRRAIVYDDMRQYIERRMSNLADDRDYHNMVGNEDRSEGRRSLFVDDRSNDYEWDEEDDDDDDEDDDDDDDDEYYEGRRWPKDEDEEEELPFFGYQRQSDSEKETETYSDSEDDCIVIDEDESEEESPPEEKYGNLTQTISDDPGDESLIAEASWQATEGNAEDYPEDYPEDLRIFSDVVLLVHDLLVKTECLVNQDKIGFIEGGLPHKEKRPIESLEGGCHD